MRNSFLSPRSVVRRGFSLTELVVVLTVLGLLAAVSVAGFRALVSESEDQAAVASAASVEREM